jgi:hypothetical protein
VVIALYSQDLTRLPPLPMAQGAGGLWGVLDLEDLILIAFVVGPKDTL